MDVLRGCLIVVGLIFAALAVSAGLSILAGRFLGQHGSEGDDAR